MGLVGVNGSGKSSLMKILAGGARPDAGELQLRRGARVTYLPQEPEFPEGATVASRARAWPRRRCARRWRAHAELSAQAGVRAREAHEKLLEQLAALSRPHRAAGRLGHRAPREDAARPARREGLGPPGGASSPAACASAWPSRARCSRGRTCCCWTSPPTTWTRTRWTGSRRSWTSSPARCCWSPTTATSSTAWWTASWRSQPGEGVDLATRATTRRTWSRSWWPQENAERRASTSASGGSPRRWPGCARARRRGAPRARRASSARGS